MKVDKAWKLRPSSPVAAPLAREAGITPLQAQLLINRGVSDKETVRAFLSPRLSQMADPMLLKGMDSAVKVIIEAMQNRDKITIYGDFDADGLTATALLANFFSELGVSVASYIPNRLEEGYGLNRAAVEKIGRNGTDLIITVDCGISGEKEIDLAKTLGMDVVVTDHHQIPKGFRPNCPVLNPHQPGCPFPFKDLAGVGVAFFLAVGIRTALRERALFRGRPEPDLREYLDLVALGTVADRVSLLGQNRMLVKNGLERMAGSKWPGISAMMDAANIKDSAVSSDDLAFRLAPRLNAPGRMGDSNTGLQILTASEGRAARDLARCVNAANGRRQRLEKDIFDQIEEMINRGDRIRDQRALFLGGKGWHLGVLGIVASRLVERYNRPSLVFNVKDGVAAGSGRSVEGFNLYQALSGSAHLFLKFGGHAHAAGFRMEKGNIEELRRDLESLARQSLTKEGLVPTIDVDREVSLKEIDNELISQINALCPFGEGNPEPVFFVRSLEVVGSRVVGESHLKLRVRHGEKTMEAIGFGLGGRHPLQGKTINVLFTPELNRWQEHETIQLKIVDLRSE